MIVMLMLSSLAAALVPVRDDEEESSSTTATETPAHPPTGPGEAVEARIDAGEGEPKTIRIALGDQLTLQVADNSPGEVSIPDLDLLEAVEPGTPAHFDLLPTSSGTYEVRLLDGDVLLGEIIVGSPSPQPRPEKGSGNGDNGAGGGGGGGGANAPTPA